MSVYAKFGEIIKDWDNKYKSMDIKKPFPLEELITVLTSYTQEDIFDSDLIVDEEMGSSEINSSLTFKEAPVYQENVELSNEKREKIGIYLTILIKKEIKEQDFIINKLLLGAFYNLGVNIGEEAVIIKYIKEYVQSINESQIDFTRNIVLIKKLGLNVKKAPFIVFSYKPLDEIIDTKNEKYYGISLNIKDKKLFLALLDSLGADALEGSLPPVWKKLVSFAAHDYTVINFILNKLKIIFLHFKDMREYFSSFIKKNS